MCFFRSQLTFYAAFLYLTCVDVAGQELDTTESIFASFGSDDSDDSNLAYVKDGDGNKFRICEGYVKFYAFRIGVFRFAVTALPKNGKPVDINACLRMQNAIMRITRTLAADTTKPSGLQMINIKSNDPMGDFRPTIFIKGILDRFVGKSEGEIFQWVESTQQSFNPPQYVTENNAIWKPDDSTDRLFVFSMSAIGKLPPSLNPLVAYLFGMLESSVDSVTHLDDTVLNQFVEECTYRRFSNPDGGIWQALHRDGGATLFFGEKNDFPNVPFDVQSRMVPGSEKHHRFGRPCATFSLAELTMFKRTFIRATTRHLRSLLNRPASEHDVQMARRLHECYGNVLWYRGNCGEASLVSSSHVR